MLAIIVKVIVKVAVTIGTLAVALVTFLITEVKKAITAGQEELKQPRPEFDALKDQFNAMLAGMKPEPVPHAIDVTLAATGNPVTPDYSDIEPNDGFHPEHPDAP